VKVLFVFEAHIPITCLEHRLVPASLLSNCNQAKSAWRVDRKIAAYVSLRVTLSLLLLPLEEDRVPLVAISRLKSKGESYYILGCR
jgi:hypothetical protein